MRGVRTAGRVAVAEAPRVADSVTVCVEVAWGDGVGVAQAVSSRLASTIRMNKELQAVLAGTGEDGMV